jgi:hypothetical protein
MSLITLELPSLDSWEYEVELDGTVYLLRGLLLKPPDIEPYYVLDLMLPDKTPIELGMKLNFGYRMAFRGGNEDAPQGTLFLQPIGSIAGDTPTTQELKDKAVLCYDEAVS